MQLISSVVLNFNTDADVVALVPQLLAQQGVNHNVIIVDNASSLKCVTRLQEWLRVFHTDAVVGSPEQVKQHIQCNLESLKLGGRVYLVLNHENRGYSAGNNIGIHLAEAMNSCAVLIANPDMRIENPRYIVELSDVLLSNDRAYIAASRVLGLDGKDQNPLREATFWEELFWPRFYLSKIFKTSTSYILTVNNILPISVPKVSGCCLMLSMAFLKMTNNLDEGVFLYCEEPILSARVSLLGGNIIYVPSLSAVHAHVKSEKANASERVLLAIESRIYYLKHYSTYGFVRILLLRASYAVLVLLHRIKNTRGVN
jgi:GT2 family glycosyltransferase